MRKQCATGPRMATSGQTLNRFLTVRVESDNIEKIMNKYIPRHFLSRLLLMVMLTVMGNGLHEGAHAMHTPVTATGDSLSQSEISGSQQCPCTPLEQHNDCDGCDKCVNCTCHAPLTIQPFQIIYNPSILDNLYASDPFKHLPEVYLPKFIPPQNPA